MPPLLTSPRQQAPYISMDTFVYVRCKMHQQGVSRCLVDPVGSCCFPDPALVAPHPAPPQLDTACLPALGAWVWVSEEPNVPSCLHFHPRAGSQVAGCWGAGAAMPGELELGGRASSGQDPFSSHLLSSPRPFLARMTAIGISEAC